MRTPLKAGPPEMGSRANEGRSLFWAACTKDVTHGWQTRQYVRSSTLIPCVNKGKRASTTRGSDVNVTRRARTISALLITSAL